MVGSKIYIPHVKPLSLGLEKALRTFVEEHPPAAIAFVRYGDASSLSPEPLAAVLDSTPEGRDLERLYLDLKQRELEKNWTNRQW